jgi:hypothetical protein
MDLSIYKRSRKFKLLHLKTTERVGGEAVLWALIGGPLYFWKRGAMIEALVIGAATLPFWAIDTEGYLLDGVGGLVWLGAVLFAPVLLAMSYQRRGWTDVTDRPRTFHLDDIEPREATSAYWRKDDLRRSARPRDRALEPDDSPLD